MFGSAILEVAIGLVLLFLFVSLICTGLREALEGLLKTRAMDLERGIRELLNDPSDPLAASNFFKHPTIYALFGGEYDAAALKKTVSWFGLGERWHMPLRKRRNLPSYIPAGHFAATLIDLVARGPVEPNAGPAGATTPAYIPANAPLSIEGLREAALTIQNKKLSRAMVSAIDQAEGDISKLKENLEGWFNGSMDRVSGWYKRRTQLILFLSDSALPRY